MHRDQRSSPFHGARIPIYNARWRNDAATKMALVSCLLLYEKVCLFAGWTGNKLDAQICTRSVRILSSRTTPCNCDT